MDDYDLLLAQRLQEEFDRETANAVSHQTEAYELDQPKNPSTSRPLSVVDASWEFTDPNPDVHALFLQFNDQFFWGRLAGVEVKWSPRMTLCAGVCSYEGRGGLCSIRLSVPLLKLRPRKDLVETLLHEMIHAYLFVTENDRDRDGHGPNFQKHMDRINKASGANITIYHDFHDEVYSYRQHWWRCDGPCRDHKPYFGFVKRAMNRAPSSKDFWWEEHQRTCGGTYTKVKEPEGFGERRKDSKEEKKGSTATDNNASSKSMDIRSFLGKGNVLGGSTSSQQNKTQDKKTNGKRSSTVTSTTKDTSSGGSYTGLSDKEVKNTNTNKISATKKASIDSVFKVLNRKNSDGEKKDGGGASTSFSDIIDLNGEDSVDDIVGKTSVPKFKDGNTWAVDGTDSGDLSKTVSRGSDDQGSKKSGVGGTGRMLGNGSVSLNWLSTARKQWAASASTDQKTTQSTKENTGTSVTSASDDCVLDDSHRKMENNSEDSSYTHYGSFHVSSCEEDKWPTPESYYKKKGVPPDQTKSGKRTAVDLLNSDDDDEEWLLPAASKRLKVSPSKSLTSPCKSDAGAGDWSENVFERVKRKNEQTSPMKIISTSTPRKDRFDSEFPDQFVDQCTRDLTDSGAVAAARDFPMSPSRPGASGNVGISPGSLAMAGSSFETGSAAGGSLVDCPVCQVPMPEASINQHLDLCLA